MTEMTELVNETARGLRFRSEHAMNGQTESFPRSPASHQQTRGIRRGRDSNPRKNPSNSVLDVCGNCGLERFFCGCYPPGPWEGQR